jgi:hypothetical protein
MAAAHQARRRMGACETIPPANAGDNTTLKDSSTKDLPRIR